MGVNTLDYLLKINHPMIKCKVKMEIKKFNSKMNKAETPR